MPFTNLEIQLIHRLVGELCERRAPDRVEDKIRLTYTVDNQQVLISEERPFRDPSAEWIVVEIAKLRYVRTRNEWQLYWKRASGKWWPYKPHSRSKTLAAMIEEIDVDSDGCFFG
jgi:Protein of unknown function (DUF3024)